MKKRFLKTNRGEHSGYYTVPEEVAYCDKLKGSEKLVLCYLMSLAVNTESIHPSVEKITKMTFQSESTVKRAVKAITSLGLFTITQRGNGRGLANSYQVNADAINQLLGCDYLIDTTQPEKKDTAPEQKQTGNGKREISEEERERQRRLATAGLEESLRAREKNNGTSK